MNKKETAKHINPNINLRRFNMFILFYFILIWFYQGISPSVPITAQVNSRTPDEEVSENLTHYSMGRWDDDGVNYQPLYAEKMG